MVKRATPSVPTPAAELAAKLEAITTAAPGLWRAGVTSIRVGELRIELQEPPPVPSVKSEEEEDAARDPLSIKAYRRAVGVGQ